MTGVATAIGIGAVATVGGTVYAANSASKSTANATNAAIGEQQSALQQQASLSAPYRNLGQANIGTYQNLLTGPNPTATLQSLPGYQATLQTGTEAAQRAAAASGLNLSGNQVVGTETFGAQLADSTYQQELNNLLQPIQIGQAAAAGQSANIGQTASNIAGETIQQGQTQAGITSNEIAGLTKAGSTASNQYLTYNTLQGLNNPSNSNPYNLGGSTPQAPAGSNLTYDPYGNITGSAPVSPAGGYGVYSPVGT